MNLFHLLRPLVVLFVAVGLVTFSSRASAEEREHRLRGTALLLDGIVTGAGNATHLGNYTETGFASISGENPFALELEGCVILTAANGVDKLWEHVSGHLNFFTGEITATVTFMGGEGRFADASGSADLLGQVGPDGISVVVEGKINY